MMVEPITLGGGKRLFPDNGQARPLKLVSAVTSGTGVLMRLSAASQVGQPAVITSWPDWRQVVKGALAGVYAGGYVGGMSGRAVPSAEGQAVPVRDVVVMRALAHPARLALLEHLGHSGPATATECAGVVGLSPSAVSYHLRALARAGLVEAAPGRGDGRERLWRRTAERYEIEGASGLAPEAREARQELLESVLAWDETRVRRYLARIDDEPKEWQDAALFASTTLLVTAEELQALGRAVQDLLAPYLRGSRADAPGTARAASVVVRMLPG